MAREAEWAWEREGAGSVAAPSRFESPKMLVWPGGSTLRSESALRDSVMRTS